MRKRNVHIQFWLNRKEAEALDKKVRRSGLSREAYLRHLIDGVVQTPGKGLRAGSVEREIAELQIDNAQDVAREIKRLEKRMIEHARNLEFEQAAQVRDQLGLLRQRVFGGGDDHDTDAQQSA